MEKNVDDRLYWEVISNARIIIDDDNGVLIPEGMSLTMIDCSDCSDCKDSCPNFCAWGG